MSWNASLVNIADMMLNSVGASMQAFYAIGYTGSAGEGALIQNLCVYHSLPQCLLYT